jgi:hypothetical protein
MLTTKCPGCGQAAKVPENLVGRRVKCPGCGDPFTVTVSGAPAAPPAKKPTPAAVKPVPRPAPKPAPAPMGEDDLDVVEETPPKRGAAPPAEDDGEPRPTGTGRSIQYMRAYKYVFENPKYLGNLFMMGLCGVIPFVGGLVLGGYLWEVMETLHREGDTSYPAFDFGRFGKNLMRGLWVFVLGLIVSVPIAILFFVLSMLGLVAFWILPPTPAAIVSQLWQLVLLVGMFLVSIATIPAAIRVGLSQQLALGETFSFAKDFLQRVGLKLLLAQLFLSVTGGPLLFLSLLCCGLPALVVAPLVCLASVHLWYQLYEVYLDQGGQMVPLKSEE